jgi:hypothetical protein
MTPTPSVRSAPWPAAVSSQPARHGALGATCDGYDLRARRPASLFPAKLRSTAIAFTCRCSRAGDPTTGRDSRILSRTGGCAIPGRSHDLAEVNAHTI